jgi:phage tail-like protein
MSKKKGEISRDKSSPDFVESLFPVLGFYFEVEIDGNKISFQEVSGLDQEAEVLEYRAGNSVSLITQKRLGLAKSTNITFKKGVFESDSRLTDLFGKSLDDAKMGKAYQSFGEPISLKVSLKAPKSSKAAMVWNVSKAVPVKFTSPTLKSDSAEVAIESIEFAHEGVTIEVQG